MARKATTNKTRRINPLDEQLRLDAEAMMAILRARGRNPDWIEDNYPRDWGNQCYILQGLPAND